MPEKPRRLMVVSDDLVKEFRKHSRTTREKSTGSIVGGVEAKHFKGSACVFAELLDANGKAIATELGPFALWDGGNKKDDKLCLSQDKQGFSYFNLAPGEYLLNLRSAKNQLLKSQLVRVGFNRVSVVVN